ncbi:hypothetical protein CoNPh26_CDS0155 [Staphylococcus phage S-CoN_Ph26]|nr:hypothetical protein CoNPh26_CDS0155 [Staphylococcus phage S-CoN_Ph26]
MLKIKEELLMARYNLCNRFRKNVLCSYPK